MRKRWLILLLLTMTVFLINGCGTKDLPGELEGWVVGSSVEEGIHTLLIKPAPADGETGVPGVSVAVEGTTLTAVTDENGYFRLSGLKAGVQILEFVKDGYESNRLQATVVGGIMRPAALAVNKRWTVLVYLDGDNNLESYGVKDVNEMETVGSTGDVNMLVQFDRIPGYDTTNGNWTNTRRYYILKDKKTSTISSSLIENMTEQRMDDPAVLQSFVEWGVTAYPADNYLLVLWNHGAGVWPRSRERGVCFDDTSGSSACLNTDEVRIALAGVYANTGRKVDIVAMDACLMQMMEVAYELKGVCNYLVGSEENVPGNGYPYNTMMAALTATPSMSAADCSIMLVNKYADSYSRSSTTCSALDLNAWSTFVGNVKNFATALNNTAASNLPAIQTISAGSQRYGYPENVDLFDFASRIYGSTVPDSTLKLTANAVMTTLSQAVIANRCTGTYNNGRSRGVAILLPTNRTDWNYYTLYSGLMWAMETVWDDFIFRLSAYW